MGRAMGAAESLWATAQALNRAAAAVSPAAGGLPPLLFLTDPDRTPRPWETAARLPAGSAVVFRGFGRPEAPDEARRLRAVTLERGARLLVGLDADLAEAVGADGVHLPERALARAGDLMRRRPDWLVTGAVHSLEAAARAAPLGALIASPVFAAGGASAHRPPLGIEGFAAMARAAPAPVYVLGGITAINAQELEASDSGACGLAAIGAVQAAFGSPA